MDEPLIPYWTRYTRLDRFWHMTDLARQTISDRMDDELREMTS